MLMFLFKLGLTFFFLTTLSIVTLKIFSELLEEEVIDSKHEEIIAKYNLTAICGFGSLTLIIALFWVFGVVWSL